MYLHEAMPFFSFFLCLLRKLFPSRPPVNVPCAPLSPTSPSLLTQLDQDGRGFVAVRERLFYPPVLLPVAPSNQGNVTRLAKHRTPTAREREGGTTEATSHTRLWTDNKPPQGNLFFASVAGLGALSAYDIQNGMQRLHFQSHIQRSPPPTLARTRGSQHLPPLFFIYPAGLPRTTNPCSKTIGIGGPRSNDVLAVAGLRLVTQKV